MPVAPKMCHSLGNIFFIPIDSLQSFFSNVCFIAKPFSQTAR